MIDKIIQNIDKEWLKLISSEFDKTYFKEILSFLQSEKEKGKEIYPNDKYILNAFKMCNLKDTKVVIIGQDPYHGIGQANGLCFSVNNGIKIPPSLRNIFKELQQEFNKKAPTNGDLSHWARQGVLMLNTCLTVEKALPGSHQNIGWEIFTQTIIELLSANKAKLVFLLWGKQAQKIQRFINPNNQHLVLKSVHPSPLSAYKGFIGNNHFIKCNKYLKQNNLSVINWL